MNGEGKDVKLQVRKTEQLEGKQLHISRHKVNLVRPSKNCLRCREKSPQMSVEHLGKRDEWKFLVLIPWKVFYMLGFVMPVISIYA